MSDNVKPFESVEDAKSYPGKTDFGMTWAEWDRRWVERAIATIRADKARIAEADEIEHKIKTIAFAHEDIVRDAENASYLRLLDWIGYAIERRDEENTRLRAFIAGLGCQKPDTCCSRGLCTGKGEGSTHWFIGCSAPGRSLPRDQWCLPCQMKLEVGK